MANAICRPPARPHRAGPFRFPCSWAPIWGGADGHGRMMNKFFENEQFKAEIVKLLGQLVHSDVNRAG